MVSLSQVNKKYGKYLEKPIIRESQDSGYVYFVYLKKPYVWEGNNSVFSEESLEDIIRDMDNVKPDIEWWNAVYPND